MRKFEIFLATSILSIGIAAAANSTAYAESERMVFPDHVKFLPKIKSITAVLVPDYMTFAVRLNSTTLKEFGCKYVSEDQIEIEGLMGQVSEKVKFTMNSEDGEIRQGLYLNFADGSKMEIAFGKGKHDYAGRYYYDIEDAPKAISIQASLLNDMQHWASRAKAEYLSDYSERACAEYINEMK